VKRVTCFFQSGGGTRNEDVKGIETLSGQPGEAVENLGQIQELSRRTRAGPGMRVFKLKPSSP
jgi:hypothetical protein